MEERERNLLLLLGVAALGAGFYYVVLPMYYEYGNLKSKIESNVNEIQSAQTQAAQLQSLVKELEDTKRKLKKAKQKLPDRGKFRELMTALESQARQAGIPDRKILEFSQGGVSTIEDGLVEEMVISAQFDSISMQHLVEMLWRFDNMIRMLDIKSFRSFDLQRVQVEDQFFYNVNMKMTVYILRDAEAVEDEEGEEA